MEVCRRPWRVRQGVAVVLDAPADIDMSGSISLCWMFVQRPIMLKQLHLIVGGEVLVSEKDNAALRHKKSQLIQLMVAELRELDIFEHRPNRFRQVNTLGNREKSLLLGIGKQGSVFFGCEFSPIRLWGGDAVDLRVEMRMECDGEARIWRDVLSGLKVSHRIVQVRSLKLMGSLQEVALLTDRRVKGALGSFNQSIAQSLRIATRACSALTTRIASELVSPDHSRRPHTDGSQTTFKNTSELTFVHG